MKKTIRVITIAVSFCLTSCQKEYTCVCTNSNTGHVHYGDKMKTGPFTKTATEETCKNNDELSGGALKDCHLE
jgi:hypothetical protein